MSFSVAGFEMWCLAFGPGVILKSVLEVRFFGGIPRESSLAQREAISGLIFERCAF